MQMEVSASSSRLVLSHKLKFFTQTEVNMMKLYFSNPSKPGVSFSYQIGIEILDGGKVVYSQQQPHYSFYQYTVAPYEAKADKNSDYALTIGDLNHFSKDLRVVITFSSLTSAAVDPKAAE